MMKDRGLPESEETVQIDVTYEIYLKHRDDPVNFNATFEVRKEAIRPGSEVEDVMNMATSQVFATIDVVREHRFILSDRNFNKGIFLTDDIQAVSILAPSEERIMEAMEA
jgi:hypothetical protein